MSAIPCYDIACNWPGCGERARGEGETVAEARASMRALGWQVAVRKPATPGIRGPGPVHDYCPTCRRRSIS